MPLAASFVLLALASSPLGAARSAVVPSEPARAVESLAVQSQASPIRAGTYDLAITFGGGQLDATLEIGYSGDTLTAVLKLGDHQSPVKPGKRTGNKLILEPASPAMDVRYDLEFDGETVKGSFVYQGQDGALTGRRRRAER